MLVVGSAVAAAANLQLRRDRLRHDREATRARMNAATVFVTGASGSSAGP
jgi:FlaA1/EpsC-like NDP-sugar epimerase